MLGNRDGSADGFEVGTSLGCKLEYVEGIDDGPKLGWVLGACDGFED